MSALTFEDEIQLAPINLPRAALRYAQEIAYPALDLQAYLARLDELAWAGRSFLSSEDSVFHQSEQLASYLFEREGFQGDVNAYIDPRNSYLNDVLERRRGLPITLSVLYLAVAERLALPARGVGLPGHFIVRVDCPDGPVFLDPFNGGKRLSVIDCARLVELSTGYSGPFKPEWLADARPLNILYRMLYNLRNVYIQQDNWQMALPVVERLLLIQPDQPEHLRDLGTIHIQLGSLRLAIEYYQRYLNLSPQAADAPLVRRNLKETARKLSSRN